jgi:hypothetical protein
VTTFKTVQTRKQAQVVYNHILDNVLGGSDGTSRKTSLDKEGIVDFFGLINKIDDAIDSQSYKDTSNNNVVTPVRLEDKMLVPCFENYVANCHLEGEPIGDDLIKC